MLNKSWMKAKAATDTFSCFHNSNMSATGEPALIRGVRENACFSLAVCFLSSAAVVFFSRFSDGPQGFPVSAQP